MGFIISFFTVVETYEFTGKHTYLPMAITAGMLFVNLASLVVLYGKLSPNSDQKDIVCKASHPLGTDILPGDISQIFQQKFFSKCPHHTFFTNKIVFLYKHIN